MRRLLLLGLALLPGCSNAPIAGTLDCLFPNRMKPPPVLPEIGRDRDRAPETIRPTDRNPLPPVDPFPFDDPRRGRIRSGDPIRRADPASRGDDSALPLLPPPGGLDDPLPPPGGRR